MTKMNKTERGFSFIEFIDRGGVKCSLQKSSLGTEDCVWFGSDNIGLKRFEANKGWENVYLEQTFTVHHVANNRMHLTQENVRELLPYLQRFAETGELHE